MIGAPRFVRVFVCALLVASMVPVVSAQAVVPPGTTYYVDVATGDNGNTGGEADPFKTIGYALEGADPGDTVMVAPGHYSSSETTSSGEKFPLYVEPGVKLMSSGGKDVTILDADYRANVITIVGGGDKDPTPDGTMPPPMAMNPAIVDGFTVTRGSQEYGGGIYVGGADAILRNLHILRNSAWEGAGVYVGGSLTTVEDCTFEENGYAWWMEGEEPKVPVWSDISLDFEPSEIPTPPMFMVETAAGGGLYAEESWVQVNDSYFDTNAAEYFGGGIGAHWANLDIDNTDFYFNIAIGEGGFGDPAGTKAALEARAETIAEDSMPYGGGAVGTGDVALTVTDCDFELNFGEAGGAVLIADAYELQSVTGCNFDSNMAMLGSAIFSGWDGFWMWETHEKSDIFEVVPVIPVIPVIPEMPEYGLTVDQSVFEDNWSLGGVVATTEASTTIQNCLFDNNMAYMATVMADTRFGEIPWVIREERSFETDSLPMPMNMSVVNSTFTENIADLSVYAPWGYVGNSIFWNNDYSLDGPPYLPVREEEPKEPYMEYIDVVADWVEYSNLEYGWDWGVDRDDWGEGNISEDPMFYWPQDREFWLIAGSPSIDTASDEVAPSYDLIDTDRPLDGDDDGAAQSDMGAYEYVFEGEVRTGGGDRYGTSIATVQEYFDSADAVVIARGDVFADGLAAAGLCGVYEAPLLLTQPNFLPDGVKAEIMRLGATKAYIMGGTGAVSAGVEDTIEGMGLEVVRIGGATRYHTAAMIADQIVSEVGTPTATFIARGDLFADALTVSPVAYGIKSPILLVRPDSLPDATIDVLDGFNPENIVITGGAGAVSEAVEDSIESMTTTADRIDGWDRYDTAIGFSDYAVTMGWAHWDTVGLATGKAFPDALTGGPAIGAAHGVLLMTGPTELYDGVEVLLTDKADEIGRLDVLGGTGAISETVSDAAFAAVQ